MGSTFDLDWLFARDESPDRDDIKLDYCMYLHVNGEFLLKPMHTETPRRDEFAPGGFVKRWWPNGTSVHQIVADLQQMYPDEYISVVWKMLNKHATSAFTPAIKMIDQVL